MTGVIEVPAEAWRRRGRPAGEVDFTMMYVAHDAFGRDLARLITAAAAAQGFTRASSATSAWFREQLHTHHTGEDTALWPRLATVVTDGEAGTLAAMEAEHSMIDPMLARIDATISERRTAVLGTLPLPARVLYRTVWERRYRTSGRLTVG
jgi:iron-sulfur cluster repair protein YtfE (RIC family)